MDEKRKRHTKSIDELRPIDDICGSVFFQDRICVEILLREVLGNPFLEIETTEAQKVVRNIFGRGGQLDVLAYDSEQGMYDIEFQEEKPGAIPDRAFFNYALLAQHRIQAGVAFKDFPYIHIVFVLEGDFFKFSKPVEKMRFFLGDRELLGLKLGIVYVNAKNPDVNTSLGRVLHDLLCENPKDMLLPEFAKRLEKIRDPLGKERGVMGKYSEMLQKEAREYGREEGREEGRKEGESRLAKLISFLLKNGKQDEIERAASNPDSLPGMYVKYGIS